MKANMKPLKTLALLLVVGAISALFLSSQAKADSLDAGVAAVNGKIQLVASNPAASLAEFTIISPNTGRVWTKIAFKSTRLRRVLGIIDVNYLVSGGNLAIVDSPLGVQRSPASGN
jgi:hypothetical protein